MNITTFNEENRFTMKLSGRLDSTTAEEFDQVLFSSLTEDMVSLTIDLAETDFISSRGIRSLVGAYKTLNGRELILTGANASVTEVLRLSGLLKIFKIL